MLLDEAIFKKNAIRYHFFKQKSKDLEDIIILVKNSQRFCRNIQHFVKKYKKGMKGDNKDAIYSNRIESPFRITTSHFLFLRGGSAYGFLRTNK